LRFTVANYASHNQIRIVKGGAVGMHESITQFPSFMNRTRRLGRCVARYSSGKRELAEQTAHPVEILADLWIGLAVGSFQPCIRDHRGSTMPRSADEENVRPA